MGPEPNGIPGGNRHLRARLPAGSGRPTLLGPAAKPRRVSVGAAGHQRCRGGTAAGGAIPSHFHQRHYGSRGLRPGTGPFWAPYVLEATTLGGGRVSRPGRRRDCLPLIDESAGANCAPCLRCLGVIPWAENSRRPNQCTGRWASGNAWGWVIQPRDNTRAQGVQYLEAHFGADI